MFLLVRVTVQPGAFNLAVVGAERSPACPGEVEINTKSKIVLESFVTVSQLCI